MPSATTLAWQRRYLHSEGCNANVQPHANVQLESNTCGILIKITSRSTFRSTMKAAQLLRQLRVPMIKFPARMNADGSRKCYFKPATSQPSCIPPCVEDGAAFLWVFLSACAGAKSIIVIRQSAPPLLNIQDLHPDPMEV